MLKKQYYVVIYKYEYSLLQLSTNSADITYYIRGGINNEIKALHTLDCCGFYDLVIDGHIFCRNFSRYYKQAFLGGRIH